MDRLADKRAAKNGERGRRRWTLRRAGMWAGCLMLGAVIAGELGARYIVGLGDPPLFVLDPEIEYLLKPGQKCRRFGHDYVVNAQSMRSEDFAVKKPEGQLRVMVIGDSVVNGGGKIDQSELATTLLQRELAATLKRDVVVGNISAPSWGPPNQLAYVKKYGIFDADVVVIVSNSDDWDDVPGLEYVGSSWPREKPWCALQELAGVYGWKAFCKAMGRAPEPPPPARAETHDQDIERCRVAYGDLIAQLRAKGAKVAVVQWWKRSELLGTAQTGFATMKNWASGAGLEPVSTAAILGPGTGGASGAMNPFQPGDDIHPNAHGHKLLADVLQQVVIGQYAEKEGQTPPLIPPVPPLNVAPPRPAGAPSNTP